MNVDDREPVRIINELRSKVDDIKVCRLETADYTIGDFGIERKLRH
jgi:ERCC4-type nuclease